MSGWYLKDDDTEGFDSSPRKKARFPPLYESHSAPRSGHPFVCQSCRLRNQPETNYPWWIPNRRLLGFPVAVVLGWLYEVGAHGIRRTRPAGPEERNAAQALRRADYLILAALAGVAVTILYGTVSSVVEEQDPESPQANPHLSNRNIGELFTYWATGQEGPLDEAVLRGNTHLDRSRSPDGSFDHKDLVMDVALLRAVKGDSSAERLMHRGMRALAEDQATMSGYRQLGCWIFGIAKATQSAVECIRDALVDPGTAMPFLEPLLPYHDPIRHEPEFVDLLTDLDLVDAKNPNAL